MSASGLDSTGAAELQANLLPKAFVEQFGSLSLSSLWKNGSSVTRSALRPYGKRETTSKSNQPGQHFARFAPEALVEQRRIRRLFRTDVVRPRACHARPPHKAGRRM